MKDQINTIREALAFLDARFGWAPGEAPAIDALRATLVQIEKMVGAQEPVAWCPALTYPGHEKDRAWANGKPRKEDIEYWTLNGKGITYAYAAPVAQQYEAGDVASAAAQGFRDGVASVAKQPHVPEADCGNIDWKAQYEHQKRRAERWIAKYEADIGPLEKAGPVAQQPQAEPDDEILKERDDAEDFIDMLLDEVLGTDRPEWTSAYGRDDALRDVQERMTALHKPMVDKAWDRFEKAQQPQARPDFTDEWTGYLKDGETPFERFLRERKDLNALTKLYQRVLEENERLKAQQPQAEAVPTVQIVNCDTCKHSANSCDDYPCNRCGVEFGDGPFNRWEAPQQAEAVHRYVLELPDGDKREVKIYWIERQETAGEITHRLCIAVDAAPQQAEAVPSSDLNPDEGDPVTLWAEIWRLREAVKGPDGYATWQDAATAERIRRVRAESKQAEEAKAVPTHDDTDLIKQMLEALRSCSGVSHWPALIPTINAARKRLETPQQAEAVPPDVVRDAERYRWLRDQTTDDGIAIVMKNKCINDSISYAENINKHIDAAISQQKGGV